ncbi:MAG TPA: ThiF family adenylyltransferase [Thermoanaerobaculia bacterium]|jgi:hypothetical protein|nr:ThiF family adenylyltransferase [Thermoanaerobaculia bacterium]
MMPIEPDLTLELRAGRRAIEGVAGCQILADFQWLSGVERWALHLRLAPPGLEPTELVPASTDWFLLVGKFYPDGPVGLYPAKENGIVHTFPHQALNAYGPEDRPLRSGKICTDTSVRVLGRHGLDEEPRAAATRMRWHVSRALEWLHAASKDQLIRQGEPFELPDYPFCDGCVVGFLEDAMSAAVWATTSAREGLVELARYPGNDRVLVVRQISTWSGKPLFRPAWGAKILVRQDVATGIWVRWDAFPRLPPWQPPTTGKELQQAAVLSGTDLLAFLDHLPDSLRDGRPHLLLIGFPISRRYEMPMERLHWLAVELPPFARKGQKFPGFRPGKAGRMIDRRELLNIAALRWVRSENWSEDEISVRGRFEAELRQKEILLVGAGALGSAVAELLVRGGAYKLTILDDEILTPGNLVRHSLGMNDVGRSKAESLSEWLNGISPHASVKAIAESFPPDPPESIGAAEIVLDFTGDDDVLAELARFRWAGERLFMSASLGFHARRVFLFQGRAEVFPREEMVRVLHQPWLLEERERSADTELPWEGIGCWHPIFPVRVDDIRLFASVIVKKLERLACAPASSSALLVFERDEGDCLLRQVGESPNA